MTIRAPAIDLCRRPRGCYEQQSRLPNSNAVMKDRVSDSQTYESRCLFVSYFTSVSYRKQMYLFVSQQSVYMKDNVSVTEKTRHSVAHRSHYRDRYSILGTYCRGGALRSPARGRVF